MDLRELGGKVWAGCIWLRIGPMVDSCVHGNEPSDAIKDRECPD